MPFLEIKQHINKPDQSYTCDLISWSENRVFLQYVATQAWHIADVHLPAGTRTLALYETGAHCVVWRMTEPGGALLGHLFHLCTDIKIAPNQVSYLDLLLDIWVNCEGQVTLLDEDELSTCVADGKLTRAQMCDIQQNAAQIQQYLAFWFGKFDAVG